MTAVEEARNDLGAVPEGKPVDVSAVIVNWNTEDLLAECLASLREHGSAGRVMEVVVVDNASTDGSAEMVAREWPGVRLVVNEQNVGYQRANNQGIRASRGEYLLLINADAFLTAGCLDGMLARMRADSTAAVVGPRLEYGDGSWQRWTAGREPSLRAAAAYFWFLERLPRGGRSGVYLGRDEREAFRCDWVSSACMLVRRAVLDEIGLMDETYFAYMDDVDLCRRARGAGWSVWYEPGAEVVHLMGQSSKRQTGATSPLALRTFNRYFGQHRGRRALTALKAIEATGFAARAAMYGAAGMIRRDATSRSAARAHWRNLRLSLERHDV